MDIENKMNVILNKRKSLNLNDDYGIQKSWNQIKSLIDTFLKKLANNLNND